MYVSTTPYLEITLQEQAVPMTFLPALVQGNTVYSKAQNTQITSSLQNHTRLSQNARCIQPQTDMTV